MEKFHKEALTKLEMAINELEFETDYSIQWIEVVISSILDSLSEIKKYVVKTGFKDYDEEKRFFKFLKPTIVAKLIYYNAIYKIETKKPNGAKYIKKSISIRN